MVMIVTVFVIINQQYTGPFLGQLLSLLFGGGNNFPEQNYALGMRVISFCLGGDFKNLGGA